MTRKILTVLLLLTFSLSVAAIGPGEVYQKVHRAVVKIKAARGGGSGSGVVVDRDGWILTNKHVAVMSTKLHVDIEVETDGPPKMITYKKVHARVAVHKDYDYAILKIDPSEHPDVKLVVAEVYQGKLLPGQQCYIIGHPLGQTKTITNGIISTPYYMHERDPKKLQYIQTNAIVQGGNSGGPLLDDKARVIGLATFFTQDPRGGSGLTGCVPARIFSDALTSWKKAEPNKKESEAYEKQADSVLKKLDEALNSFGPDHPMVKQYEGMIGQMFSKALAADPDNPRLLTKVGRMYFRVKRYDQAPEYLLRAIQLKPWDNPNAYGYLGLSLLETKKPAEAKAALEEGLAKAPKEADYCWSGMGVYFEKQKKFEDAIFYAKIASDMAKNDSNREVQRKTYDYYYSIKTKLREANQTEPDDDEIEEWFDVEVKKLEKLSHEAKASKKDFINADFEKYMLENMPKDDPEEEKIGGDGFKVPFNRGEGEGTPEIADNSKPDKPSVTVTPDKPVTPTKPTPKPDKPSNPVEAARTKWIQRKISLAKLYQSTGKTELAVNELKKIIARYPKAPEVSDINELMKTWQGG